MAQFEPAIRVVLRHEGGYATNPRDKGGETMYGISQRSYPRLDIKSLDRDGAMAIYLRDFWKPGRYGSIRSQSVATKAFDLAVNMGRKTAARLLQTAVNEMDGRRLGGKLKVDGVIGPRTLKAVNSLAPANLLTELRAQAALRYARIALRDPTQKIFLKGWMRRAVS